MLRLPLIASLAGLALVVWALAAMSIDPAVTEAAGSSNLRELIPFWGAAFAGWFGLTWLWWRLRGTSGEDAWRWRDAIALLAVAGAARVAVVFTHDVGLSDDIYRYVFDGRNGAAGINPYLVAPLDVAEPRPAPEPWLGHDEIVPLVNNPELHTIYLPTSQWAFTLIGASVPDSMRDPASSARLFRLAFVFVEMIGIAALLVVLRALWRNAWWAALYAWHPLALSETAASGHQDALGITLLVIGLAVATMRPRRVATWTAPLALAALVKPVAIPIAPLLLRDRRPVRWPLSAGIGAMLCAVVAAPLWIGQPEAIEALRETGTRFSLKWAHFGPIYEPALWSIEQFTGHWTNDQQERVARVICLLVVGSVFVTIFVKVREQWSAARILLMTMVVASSAAHPWYMLWALALVPIAPGRAAWVASGSIMLAHAAWCYHTGDEGLRWGAPVWVMWLAWIPVAIVAVHDQVRRRSTMRA